MEKPKVYASPIDKKINNSQEFFYGSNNSDISVRYNTNDILKKIKDIFNSYNHIYKSKVLIKTDSGEIICDIVGQTANSLLTLDGKSIFITQILDIKKI